MATAEAIAREIGYPEGEIRADEPLGGTDACELLEVIRELHDHLDHVMLVGRNPGLMDLAHELSCDIDNIPTCGVVELGFSADFWAYVGDIDSTHVGVDCPKKASR